jgi:hypothetical protein
MTRRAPHAVGPHVAEGHWRPSLRSWVLMPGRISRPRVRRKRLVMDTLMHRAVRVRDPGVTTRRFSHHGAPIRLDADFLPGGLDVVERLLHLAGECWPSLRQVAPLARQQMPVDAPSLAAITSKSTSCSWQYSSGEDRHAYATQRDVAARRLHRTCRHPRRSRSSRARPNRSLISSIGVSNYYWGAFVGLDLAQHQPRGHRSLPTARLAAAGPV